MSKEKGFTIIEVTVAVVVLSIGLLGLASTAALVTRMIAQGHRYSEAAALANARFEILRTRMCPTVGSGSGNDGQFSYNWRVTSIASGDGRELQVIVTSPTGTGFRADTFATVVSCR